MANARRSPQNTLSPSPSSPASPSQRVKEWIQAGKESSSRVDIRSISETLQAASAGDYPPNSESHIDHGIVMIYLLFIAPDRPAPLRLRSFSSNAALSTPTTGHSMTSPFSDRFALDMSTPSLPRNSLLLEDTASHPLLSPNIFASASSTKTDTDDVFGIVHKSPVQQRDHSNERHDTERCLRYDSTAEHLSGNSETDTAKDEYQLDPTDVESDGSYETIEDDCSEHSHDGAEDNLSEGMTAPVDNQFEDKDSLDASGDEISVLETVSNASDAGYRTQYYFSSRRAASETTLTETTLDTPELPSVSPKYSKHNKLFPHNYGKDYERPLPLRDYIEKQEALKIVKARKFSEKRLPSPTIGKTHSFVIARLRLSITSLPEPTPLPPPYALSHLQSMSQHNGRGLEIRSPDFVRA